MLEIVRNGDTTDNPAKFRQDPLRRSGVIIRTPKRRKKKKQKKTKQTIKAFLAKCLINGYLANGYFFSYIFINFLFIIVFIYVFSMMLNKGLPHIKS